MFTRDDCQVIRTRLEGLLADFGRQHGLALAVGSIRYGDDLRITLKGRRAGAGGAGAGRPTLEAETFRQLAPRYGLRPEDYNRPIVINGRRVNITGIKPENRQYPILVTGAQGGRYKVTVAQVQAALRGQGGGLPENRRSEAEVLEELRRVEAALSPENLHWDGERPAAEARAAQRQLTAQRAALVAELGREPSDAELYGRVG